MKRLLTRLFSKRAVAATACCAAASAQCLTIVPTFDPSISGNATDGPAMKATINAAIQVFENDYADNFTLNITFRVDTSVALAQSDVAFADVAYSSYRAALKKKATSTNDTLALSHLPNTATDPVIGGTDVSISVPLANMLGLSNQSPDGNIISFNTNLMNITRPDPNNNNFDMQSAIEHEIDEVLGGGGAGCNLGVSQEIGPLDLFRYATNSTDNTLARSWTLNNGDNAYFSVDGTNLWARFNTDQGGDLGDFWGTSQDPVSYLPLYWSPSGVTPHEEVQDAFATPNYFSYPANFEGYPTTNYYYEDTSPDLATNELTMLDILGWTLTANLKPLPAPPITIVRTGTNKITLTWPTNIPGYSLQERTNLVTGSWAGAANGSKTPAVITISNAPTFYRLFNASAKAAIATPGSTTAEPLAAAPAARAADVFVPYGKVKRRVIE